MSVLLLDGLKSHKTKAVLDEFKTLYNTKINIFPGGLTPKAQIRDTHNNRPLKFSVKSKTSALCLQKYREAKAAAASDPLHKGCVAIPKLSR